MKQLSVCIPTYNRLRYLRDLLPRLLEEVEPCADEVELVVVDNASTDGTFEYVSESARTHDCLRLVRNPENIGADRNFWRCVEVASGKYVWLFGDDDLPVKGVVKRVLEELNSHQDDRLVICMPQGTEYKEPLSHMNYRELVSCLWKSSRKFALHHTLITCNVFLRSSFNMSLAQRYLFTNYAHMFALDSAFGGRVAVLPDALVIRDYQDHAPFEKPIYFLKTKQGVYLTWLALRIRHGGLLLTGLLRLAQVFKDVRRMYRQKRKMK